MSDLVLPFSASVATSDVAFDVESSEGGGTGVKGQSLGVNASGEGGIGVSGVSTSGGVGVEGRSSGYSRSDDPDAAGSFGHPGIGVSGMSDYGGVGMQGSSIGGDVGGEGGVGVRGLAERAGTGVVGSSSGTEGGLGIGVDGSSESGPGVRGVSSAANDAGVYGYCATGLGVRGESDAGVGVYGHSSLSEGIHGSSDASDAPAIAGRNHSSGGGVYGRSDTGFAMIADGSTTQSLDSGGWLKAMVRFGVVGPGTIRGIVRCFNSQPLAPGRNPTNCGIDVYRVAEGLYIVDFGFPVRERYVAVSPEVGPLASNPLELGTDYPLSGLHGSSLTIANSFFLFDELESDLEGNEPSSYPPHYDNGEPIPDLQNKVVVVTWGVSYVDDPKASIVEGFIRQDRNFFLYVY